MIHIVFEQENVTALQNAISLDESLQGDIIEIKDDFAVGPIANIYETAGYQARRDWWQSVLTYSPYADQLDIVDDKLTVHQLIQRLEADEDAQVWIWMGQNAHDVCGYYWLMTQLKEQQGKIQVLYLNNLPFINEKGNIFYPTHLNEIQPKEFLKATKLARPITLSEFEVDPDEWKKVCEEVSGIRFLEGGKKLVGKEISFFDKEIAQHITAEQQKLPRLITILQNKMKLRVSDVMIAWRIREMGEAGKISLTGDWAKGWKEITVKVAGSESEADAVITNEQSA